MSTITPMRAWLRAATPDERKLLADKAGTTVGMLNQYAGGHRECSAARAGMIETASTAMSKASKGRLQVLLRTDLVPACRACPYAAKCLGDDVIVRGDFPIVVDTRQQALDL